ncbi:MAG: DsbA family protein [Olsenella sp.]|jgi:predicted DsbA family dithiol-disulfide isomerase
MPGTEGAPGGERVARRPRHRVVMYLDVICEWCYLAHRVLATLEGEYDFDVDYRLMEIHPDVPEEGMPMTRHLHFPDRFYDDLDALGAPYGVTFNRKKQFANTYYALLLLQCAKGAGQLGRVLDPLWDAYMVRGRNISLLPEIVRVTDACGLPRSLVAEAYANPAYAGQLEDAYRQNHLDGGEGKVPFFRVDDEYVMRGAQDADTWRALFDRLEKGAQGSGDPGARPAS